MYQITCGRKEWVTHVRDVSEIARASRRGSKSIRRLVFMEGITRNARRQIMVGIIGEVPLPEDPEMSSEQGEFLDCSSGAPLQPQLAKAAREEDINKFRNTTRTSPGRVPDEHGTSPGRVRGESGTSPGRVRGLKSEDGCSFSALEQNYHTFRNMCPRQVPDESRGSPKRVPDQSHASPDPKTEDSCTFSAHQQIPEHGLDESRTSRGRVPDESRTSPRL